MAKKPKTLKEIAIELLEKYEASETTVICEYSTNIRHSVELLGKEVAKYRKMIDKAERKDEPTISKMEQVDEPKTQTETQNSNLTFEKDECAKEYEELGLKELKELIKADRKTDCAWK